MPISSKKNNYAFTNTVKTYLYYLLIGILSLCILSFTIINFGEKSKSVTPVVSTVITKCAVENSEKTGIVLDIIDGASMRILIDGLTYVVKYAGTSSPQKTDYYNYESREKNAALVFAKKVKLYSGKVDKDANGTLLRYIYRGGLLLNEELIKNGFLGFNASDPAVVGTDCLSSFQLAEQSAKNAKIGRWGIPPTTVYSPPISNLTSQSSSQSGSQALSGWGPTAICADGTYSYSGHRRGTCSWHGGVSQWLK